MGDRIHADCEEPVRRETLEFLAMRLLTAVEAVIEQHSRTRSVALGEREQRNPGEREPALNHKVRLHLRNWAAR
jgi:hypothetical protein